VPDVLDRGRFGMLVDAGDEAALATAIGDLVADAGRRRALGRDARQHVCDTYSMDRMIDAYHAMYTGLARGARPATWRQACHA